MWNGKTNGKGIMGMAEIRALNRVISNLSVNFTILF